jgi:protein SCO1/2
MSLTAEKESSGLLDASAPPLKRLRKWSWLVQFIGVLTIAGHVMARADNSSVTPSLLRGVGIDQKLNEQIPLGLRFYDETGRSVTLGQYFGKRLVVLSLIYFRCPMLCTTAENGLLHLLENLKFNVGDEFEVLTVSFDPNDKPQDAAAKKAIYCGLYGRPGAAQGWHFLTGEKAAIDRLTEAVGFHYNYDPETRQFAHATGIVVLTPRGNISRYFYGIEYSPRDLRRSLIEASAEKIGSPVDKVLLYCSQFNPATGRYGWIIWRVLQLGGAITVLSLGALLFLMIRARPRSEGLRRIG